MLNITTVIVPSPSALLYAVTDRVAREMILGVGRCISQKLGTDGIVLQATDPIKICLIIKNYLVRTHA
jgi:hypothetical protein